MKKSLTTKIFVLIFMSIMVVFTVMGSFQFLYYSKFYEKNKIEETAHNFQTYIDDYKTKGWSEKEKLIQAKAFNINNSAVLEVIYFENDMTSTFSTIIDNQYIITTSNDKNEYFDFLLSEDEYQQVLDSLEDLDDLSKISLAVEGIVDAMDNIHPITINAVAVNTLDQVPLQGQAFSGVMALEEIYNPSSQNIFTYGGEDLFDSETSPHIEEGKFGDIHYFKSSFTNTSIKQVNFIYSEIVDQMEYSFFVNLSLQSVSESMVIYRKFLPLIIPVSFLIALVVAVIYSKQISKPIVEITEVANNMSHLSFYQTLPSNREDELGILSRSINRLSNSLRDALDDLSEANSKLKEDYENELRQELIRKNFVANVSHEIKTPLGIIKSYAEGIKDLVKKDKQDYYIDVIIDEIDRMDLLLNELLDLSKLDSGHVKYKLSSFNLKDNLDKIIQYNQTFLSQNKLDIQVTGDFLPIMADKEKMYRVLNNLITNAIKYALAGTSIHIRACVSPVVTLTIENKCLPLSQEQNKLIWHRFYKGDESHNRDIEGNGLGLSIVKSIMEGHHYTCSSSLTPDGIIFTLTMPQG